MLQWIQSNEVMLWWLAALSVVTFVSTLLAAPLLVVKIPYDYFSHEKRAQATQADDRHAAVKWALVLAKNLLGIVMIIAGIIMLFLPGQGILTIVAGIMLLNFPGKYRFERWIVSRKPVLQSVNWARRRTGKEPLVL